MSRRARTRTSLLGFGLFFLAWILLTLIIKGVGAIDLAMFTQTTPAPGSDGGGLLNPIVGSLMLVGAATLISTPIGILAGVYLAEYGEKSWLAQVTRFATDIMLSAPNSLLEAAFALGAPRWKVATMVRLRAVKAGVLTGALLALARISGETAPLLFTALNNQFFSANMNAPLANLPVVIYQFAMSPYDNWRTLAWGGALLVTFSVLGLNILSRILLSQKKPA